MIQRRHRARAGGLLLLAVGVLLAGASGCGAWSPAKRERPVGQPASVSGRPREQVVIWRTQVARDPHGATGWSYLGHALVGLARATADESVYSEAEAAFRRSLALEPRNNPSARGGLARTLMARHEFKAARAEAESALAESPWESWLLGLTGDAAMESGDYRRARHDFAELLRATDSPAAHARAAQIADLSGDSGLALREYARAEALYPADELEPRGWVLCQMGDIRLRSGDLGAARRLFEKALRMAPDSPLAQQRLAEYYEWRNQPRAARELLLCATRAVRAPELLLRLAGVQEALGNLEEAGALRQEARAHLEHHYLVGDYGHVRSLARLLLDRPAGPADLARGLQLAQIDTTVRGGVYSQWILARALRLNDRPAEALEQIGLALHLGTRDADLWLEKASSLRALGRMDEAVKAQAVARRMNPHAARRFRPGPDAPTPPKSRSTTRLGVPATSYFSGK